MNSIFHRLKKLKKSEFNFSCKVTMLTTHEFHFFFACLNKLHNIQSSFFQIEKDAKIVFVFMKNEFIIWGASALRLSGPFYFFAEERTSKKSTDSLFRIYESPKDTNSILLQAKNTQTKC